MWQVAVVMSGPQIELWVDCQRVYQRLAPPLATNLSNINLSVPLDPSDHLLPVGEGNTYRCNHLSKNNQ